MNLINPVLYIVFLFLKAGVPLPQDSVFIDTYIPCVCVSCLVVSNSLQPHDLSMEYCSKNTEVGCHSLLQRIFLTQGSGLGLPHCRQILHHLSLQGSMCVYMCVRNILLNHMCEIVSINKEITFQNIC